MTEKEKLVYQEVDNKVNEVFIFAHQLYNTKSGDITPEQTLLLSKLQQSLFDLILTQVGQNL